MIFSLFQLQFEKDLEITAMFSGEGEKIVFEKSTYPTGNVEEWMMEIENMMKDSLRIIIGKGLVNYKQVGDHFGDVLFIRFLQELFNFSKNISST